jgi:hypothetical protein
MGTSGMICPCSVYGGLYPTHVSIEAVLIIALSHTDQTGRSVSMLLGARGLVGGCLTWDIHAVLVALCKEIESSRAGRTVTCFLTAPHVHPIHRYCNPTRGLRRRDGEMWVTECVPRTGARLSGPGRKARRLELCWLCASKPFLCTK